MTKEHEVKTTDCLGRIYPADVDARLAAMNPRVSVPCWEERALAAWQAFTDHYREHPANTICMVVTATVLFGLALYGASFIAPITDPGYLP